MVQVILFRLLDWTWIRHSLDVWDGANTKGASTMSWWGWPERRVVSGSDNIIGGPLILSEVAVWVWMLGNTSKNKAFVSFHHSSLNTSILFPFFFFKRFLPFQLTTKSYFSFLFSHFLLQTFHSSHPYLYL